LQLPFSIELSISTRYDSDIGTMIAEMGERVMASRTVRRWESPQAISKWFLVNGFVVAGWIAHIPRQKIALQTTPGPLGLALLCMAVGSIFGMMAAPRMISRFGAGRAAWTAGFAFALLVPFPLLAGSVPTLGLALLAFGMAHGFMDVTMNAAAAACEKDVGRPLMSSFHGWFSVGMVAGVSGGVAALATGLAPAAHAALVITAAAGLLATSLPSRPSGSFGDRVSSGWLATLNRQTVALSVLAFVCLFLEGAMADWSGLLAASFGAGPDVAPLAYVAFTATWAGGRFAGDRLAASVGEVNLVRAAGLLTVVGVALALGSAAPVGVTVGCGIVGLGLANAVPILFRAAATVDPTARAAGLAVVTGVGYTGFLVGPPLVGFTAETVGLPRAMLLVVAGAILLAAGAATLRPRRKTTDERASSAIPCRAILFDMDGTLVDSTEISKIVWREWAANAGVDPAPILAIHHGRRPEETLAVVYPARATAENGTWVQNAGAARTDGLRPIPGAAALLDALADRPWAVVTSATRALAETRLRAVGLWRDRLVVGAEDVSEGKPSPEGYLAAANRLGVRPEECVVMEDAPAGIEAGRRAGMAVVGITTTHAPAALATPHLVRDFTAVSVEPGKDGEFWLVFPGGPPAS
jgi:HAD superfamily hydrolase (TIGR01509 family)